MLIQKIEFLEKCSCNGLAVAFNTLLSDVNLIQENLGQAEVEHFRADIDLPLLS
jgi:hypothetical protein